MVNRVGGTERQSRLGKLKNGMEKGISKFLSFPDKSKDPTTRKIWYIVYDILFIGAGVGLFLTLAGMSKVGISPQFLLNPGYSGLMAMPFAFTAAGFGFSWLVADILGPKNHEAARKVANFLTPILLLGACTVLVTMGGVSHGSSGLHYSLAESATHTTFFAGVLLSPFIFFAAARTYSQMTRERKHYVEMQDLSASEHRQRQRTEEVRSDETHDAARQAEHRGRESGEEERVGARRAALLRES